MAPCKPKATEPATTSPVKSARVTKTKSSSTASAVKGRSVPATPLKRYRNLMLNLEQTPEHLVDIAKRNATDSPLLRLPPEIRNRIWSFAMGGQLINVPWSPFQKSFAVQIDMKPDHDASKWNPWTLDMDPNVFDIKRLPAAFHLPEVCRQIYSEAALTAYQQSIFLFNDPFQRSNTVLNRLMPVQRRAIKSVGIGVARLYAFMTEHWPRVVPMTDKLPNLEYILVPASVPNCACFETLFQALQIHVDEWEYVVMRRLREVHGDKIKIEFEE